TQRYILSDKASAKPSFPGSQTSKFSRKEMELKLHGPCTHLLAASPVLSTTVIGMLKALESKTKIAKFLEKIEDLHGGKSVFMLNIILQPNWSEGFTWTTDMETVSIGSF
ncbi:hypothetical protein BGZ51_008502, partial [Haplosporangium sp. Z 767]